MVIVGAAMHKLLDLAYGILKSGDLQLPEKCSGRLLKYSFS